jgi:hypothetical protein
VSNNGGCLDINECAVRTSGTAANFFCVSYPSIPFLFFFRLRTAVALFPLYAPTPTAEETVRAFLVSQATGLFAAISTNAWFDPVLSFRSLSLCVCNAYSLFHCQVANGGCSSLQSCTNLIGSRNCSLCPAGYTTSDNICAGASLPRSFSLSECFFFFSLDINECLLNYWSVISFSPFVLFGPLIFFSLSFFSASLRPCNNYNGTFNCSNCPAGYVNNGALDCTGLLFV